MGYDNHGRITSATGVGSYTYTNPAHDGAVTTAGSHTFRDDTAGNMSTRTISGQNTQTLTWDESNRLEQVTQAGSSPLTYLYDSDGNRVARRAGTNTTVQVSGLYDWTTTSGFTSYYSHAGEPIGYRDSTGMHWQFADHLDSTTTIYTPGQTNETQRYYPYGTIRTSTGLPTEIGYTSQRLDPTGLYDYKSRPYDPITGRFIAPDTIIPQPGNPETLNRYSYTNNNPTTHNDPSGHCPALIMALGGPIGALLGVSACAVGWGIFGMAATAAISTAPDVDLSGMSFPRTKQIDNTIVDPVPSLINLHIPGFAQRDQDRHSILDTPRTPPSTTRTDFPTADSIDRIQVMEAGAYDAGLPESRTGVSGMTIRRWWSMAKSMRM